MTTTSRGAGASDGALVLTLPEHAMNAALVRASAMIIRVRSAYILVLHIYRETETCIEQALGQGTMGKREKETEAPLPFHAAIHDRTDADHIHRCARRSPHIGVLAEGARLRANPPGTVEVEEGVVALIVVTAA